MLIYQRVTVVKQKHKGIFERYLRASQPSLFNQPSSSEAHSPLLFRWIGSDCYSPPVN